MYSAPFRDRWHRTGSLEYADGGTPLGGDPKPNVAEGDANRSAGIWSTTDIKTKGTMGGHIIAIPYYNSNTFAYQNHQKQKSSCLRRTN